MGNQFESNLHNSITLEPKKLPVTAEQKALALEMLCDQIWLDDLTLLTTVKEWILTAVYEWPKWTILKDRRTIKQLMEMTFKLKWKLKSDTVIQLVNPFQKPENILDAY